MAGLDSNEPCSARSREQELEEALRIAEEDLVNERLSNAKREQQLRETLSMSLLGDLMNEIDRRLIGLQQDLEVALADILLPFLREQSTRRAVSKLMDLVDAELRGQGNPLLELSAPEELHDRISQALEQMNIPAKLSEGLRIELALPARTARFEQLASDWIAIIEGSTA